MQKKLIALAIAAALAPAAAMADTSNVTVYGIADVSFDSVDNDKFSATVDGTRVSKVSSNSSRLGLKGNEDLGGGLKAVWQIEQAITMDGGAGDHLATRNTFAGLAGDSWGQLTLGRNDTPYKSSTRALDVFADHIADNRTLMGMGTMGFDVRLTDTIRYDSPNFSGFKVAASYSTGAESNIRSDQDITGKVISLSGNYTTGPFSAAAAYQRNTSGSTTNLTNLPALAAACDAAEMCREKAWKIAGSYSVSQFAVNGIYEKTSDSLGNAANGTGHKAFYLAGVFNATANDAIKLAYAKAKEARDGNLVDSGAKQWSLGVDHSMSKRTTVYAMYTKLDNENAADYDLSSAATATGTTASQVVGAAPSAFSLGMKHSF